MSNITLTSSMRSNLSSLRNIGVQMGKTQERLSSGLKVNSAIDNASSFYQARSLTNRAADLNNLLDAMGQGIQTIQAAMEGLEAGLSFLEQAKAVAEQALAQGDDLEVTPDTGIAMASVLSFGDVAATSVATTTVDFSDYTKVTNETELQNALKDSSIQKIILDDNIELTTGLEITRSDIVLEGNGYKITFTPTEEKQAAILADGEGRSVTITNLSIDVIGEKAYGIRVANGGTITIDNIMGINVSGTGAQRAVNGDADLFDGKTNTEIIIDTDTSVGLGTTASAANAANSFYAPLKDADGNIITGALADNDEFGIGTWYLPSIGEWMELRGYEAEDVSGVGKTGVISYANSDMKKVNTILSKMGSDASVFNTSRAYWSSSELAEGKAWGFGYETGNRFSSSKNNYFAVRLFNLVENCFDPLDENKIEPEVGDIMYVDVYGNKSWGKYDTYDTDKLSKTAVGVVCDVNSSDGSVKIINLKDLQFNNSGYVINAADPYNTKDTVNYTYFNRANKDVGGLEEIPDAYNDEGTDIGSRVQSGGTLNIQNNAFTIINSQKPDGGEDPDDGDSGDSEEPDSGEADGTNSGEKPLGSVNQYANIISQYDNLIKDSSYKGINLLQGGKLDVVFNETRTNKFTIRGKDISSSAMGLDLKEWQTSKDLENSLQQINNAIETLRSYANELGNSYSIIQTRDAFTAGLTDILEEGADKLILADMNEESAEYLMLQTRQQLAVNSLSLAAQSAQSVMSLF